MANATCYGWLFFADLPKLANAHHYHCRQPCCHDSIRTLSEIQKRRARRGHPKECRDMFQQISRHYLRAAQAHRESGVNFCTGKSRSLSQCSLGCVARSSYNRNGQLTSLRWSAQKYWHPQAATQTRVEHPEKPLGEKSFQTWRGFWPRKWHGFTKWISWGRAANFGDLGQIRDQIRAANQKATGSSHLSSLCASSLKELFSELSD